MAADRNQVGAIGNRQPSRPGACVDVDQRADVVGALDDGRDRLDRPHLVVGESHRNEGRSPRDRVHVDRRAGVDPGDHNRPAQRLHPPRRAENRLMLGRPGDQRPAAPEQREVDGLRAGGDERDLGSAGAERLRGQVSCAIQGGAGSPSFGMRAGRVPSRQSTQRVGDIG